MIICPLCAEGIDINTDSTILYKVAINTSRPAHANCMLSNLARADSYERWAGNTWSANLPEQYR